MSLYEDALHDFVIINRSEVPDGYGGTTTVWTDGATIKGVVVFNTSNQAVVARSAGANVLVNFKTTKQYNLFFHEVLRDTKNNKIYRLKNEADINKTPDTASINMQDWEAEEWTLS